MVYIKSDKASDISNYLMKKFSAGVTEMTIRGGFQRLHTFGNRSQESILLELLFNIDNKAFVLTIDCYGATGV